MAIGIFEKRRFRKKGLDSMFNDIEKLSGKEVSEDDRRKAQKVNYTSYQACELSEGVFGERYEANYTTKKGNTITRQINMPKGVKGAIEYNEAEKHEMATLKMSAEGGSWLINQVAARLNEFCFANDVECNLQQNKVGFFTNSLLIELKGEMYKLKAIQEWMEKI